MHINSSTHFFDNAIRPSAKLFNAYQVIGTDFNIFTVNCHGRMCIKSADSRLHGGLWLKQQK